MIPDFAEDRAISRRAAKVWHGADGAVERGLQIAQPVGRGVRGDDAVRGEDLVAARSLRSLVGSAHVGTILFARMTARK